MEFEKELQIGNIDYVKNKLDKIFNKNNIKDNEKGDFVFRVLKSNKDEQVDFTEEKEYLKCCFIKIT